MRWPHCLESLFGPSLFALDAGDEDGLGEVEDEAAVGADFGADEFVGGVDVYAEVAAERAGHDLVAFAVLADGEGEWKTQAGRLEGNLVAAAVEEEVDGFGFAPRPVKVVVDEYLALGADRRVNSCADRLGRVAVKFFPFGID